MRLGQVNNKLSSGKWNHLFQFFITILLIAGLLFIYFIPPFKNPYYPKCIFKHFTQLECPGCGSARSLYSLLHGNLIDAIDYNAMFVMLLPVIIIGILAKRIALLKGSWNILNKPKVCLILIIIFWLVRNVNYYPFNLLHSDK